MNKYLLSFCAFSLAASAVCNAQSQTGVIIPMSSYVPEYSDVPGPGEYASINLEAYPAGISGFEINGKWRINRSAKGYITLKLNGRTVKQIPASNTRDFYCWDEFDITETGAVHVTFTQENQLNTPYKYTGYYEITIPAGFLTDENGTPNVEAVARYEINNSRFTSVPATGTSVEELSEITLTFPDATSVTGGAACGYSISKTGSEDAPDDTPITPVINGNTATFTFPQPITEAGRVMIDMPTGAFSTANSQGPATSTTYRQSLTVNVTGKASSSQDGWTVTPAPGVYDGFKSFPVEGTETSYSPDPIQAYFTIEAPEGETITGTGMPQIKLIKSDDPSLIYPVSSGFGKTRNDGKLYLTVTSPYTALRTPGTLVPEPGDYELVVFANAITSSSGATNSELRFKYTVTGSESEAKYTLTPSNAATLTEPLSVVKVDFPGASSVTWKNGSYVSIANGTVEYATREVAVEGTTLVITLPGELNMNGSYEFTLPSTALSVDGASTPLAFSYDLDLPNPYAGMTFAPTYDYEALTNVVNLEAFPQGVASFEITFDETAYPGGAKINRDARGFITLACNGQIMKQIPASNVSDFYTFVVAGEGGDKAENGDILVNFYRSQAESLAKYTGNYEVIIPAGFFTFVATGETNKEITANYQVLGNARFTVSPAAGATVESISEITVTFPEATAAKRGSGSIGVELMTSSEEGAEVAISDVEFNGTTATLKLPEEYNEKGRLMITFAANAFEVGYANGSASGTGDYACSIFIEPGASATVEGYTITPAPGSYTEIKSIPVPGTEDTNGNPFYAYFKVDTPEDVTASMTVGKCYFAPVVDGVADRTKALSFKVVVATDPDTDLKAYYFVNSTYKFWRAESTLPVESGKYQLICPVNFFKNVQGSNAADIVWDYEMLPSESELNYTVTPENGSILMEPLSEIVVRFPEAGHIEVKPGSMAKMTCGAVEYVAYLNGGDIDAGGCDLFIQFPASIVEPGKYTVTVSAADVAVDGVACPLTLEYEIDSTVGVSEIGVNADEAPVYNLFGVKVGEGMKSLRDLAPAIYIVNGKKVIVK